MASLRDIRRRIASVKSTQKITRAMKMVAAARLRRSQEAILRARPYALNMLDLVNRLALRVHEDTHPLLRAGEGDKIGLIVISSDRGLCGGFNANIVNETMRVVKTDFQGRTVEMGAVGRKGFEALRRRQCNILRSFVNVQDEDPLKLARTIVKAAVAEFEKGQTDSVHCLYSEFKSAISQRVVLERLLPFTPPSRGEIIVDYLYEPSTPAVVSALLTRHMTVQMHRMLLESAASEHGARMTAMDSATNNAGDVIERLTLQYNRARQTTITTEMIEIVSGAEAL